MSAHWQDKAVFITGAAGFLGSWLTKFLVDAGADVVALLRDIVPQSELYRSGYIHKVTIVRGALEDYLTLERALGEYQINTVFHLGAQTQVEIANRNPLSTFESNIRGTWQLLEACRRSSAVKKIVIASSDKAYGIHDVLPYTEGAALKGSHPYDVSKSSADLIALTYFNTYKTPLTITRCGNFYGGGDINFSRIIPETIRYVIRGMPPVLRSDGAMIRDYFYIEDAAHAYMMLAERMDDERIHGHAFNFSNENQVTVLDLTQKILRLMGSILQPKILATAAHEIPHQYLSAKKARDMLGWKPRYSLDEGLTKTIEWYKNYFRE
jgi:CDP-glucose 4,6-dehydratase